MNRYHGWAECFERHGQLRFAQRGYSLSAAAVHHFIQDLSNAATASKALKGPFFFHTLFNPSFVLNPSLSLLFSLSLHSFIEVTAEKASSSSSSPPSNPPGGGGGTEGADSSPPSGGNYDEAIGYLSNMMLRVCNHNHDYNHHYYSP